MKPGTLLYSSASLCPPNTRISCEGGASRPCSGADLVSCIRLFGGVPHPELCFLLLIIDPLM